VILKIPVNVFRDRESLVNGFANAGYPVCIVKGDTAIYERDKYYVVVELPDECVVKVRKVDIIESMTVKEPREAE